MTARSKKLDTRSDEPLYEQVREQLARSIAKGRYATGDQLPSEGELCDQFGVSRITVRQALANLVHSGLLVKRHGKGAFVAEPTPEYGQRVITLVLANTVGSFMNQIIHGVESVVREQGYELNLCISHDDVAQERQCLERIIENRVAGVLLFSVNTEGEKSPNCYQYLRVEESGIPLLFIDRYIAQLPIGHVVADDEGGMRTLTQHMIDLGYTSIGYVHEAATVSSVTQRYQGFLGAMADARLAPDLLVRLKDEPRGRCDDAARTYREFKHLLAEGVKLPRALVTCNLYHSIGAFRALREAGLRVPQDVALAGFDDLPEATVVDVPLTALRVPIEGMGRCAAEKLMELIRSHESGAEIAIKLPGELVVRESCGAKLSSPDEQPVAAIPRKPDAAGRDRRPRRQQVIGGKRQSLAALSGEH